MRLEVEALRIGLTALASSPSDVPCEQVPDLVAELARAHAALLTVASRPPAAMPRTEDRANEDRMLDVEEAAAMLGVSKRWLYRHAKQLPFTRPISPKIVRFSRVGIQRWLASRRT